MVWLGSVELLVTPLWLPVPEREFDTNYIKATRTISKRVGGMWEVLSRHLYVICIVISTITLYHKTSLKNDIFENKLYGIVSYKIQINRHKVSKKSINACKIRILWVKTTISKKPSITVFWRVYFGCILWKLYENLYLRYSKSKPLRIRNNLVGSFVWGRVGRVPRTAERLRL